MKVKCKQCNHIFIYEKYDGICNKCCHYYGKEGMENSESIKNQQYRDNNSYERNTAQTYATNDFGKKEEQEWKNKEQSRSVNLFTTVLIMVIVIIVFLVKAYL